ncbi:NAD(P)-dependent oxidoreductase [Aeromicrobium ginsengisoli]|uniref:Hydroxyacid dehydrogenase n=1 Tax=Aeromicrobium ginsengisoli TaxID=363867 RepID=A0A5M4FK46_9ACTN|nr:NAD(P)-dependent oxidoreductase [Aeromicrobium ginsengisoli]KAA1400342.1 hydroxyacid dehydrogenase [Aeromicrobium ginsengisoli]
MTLRVTVPDEGWLERLSDLDDRVDLSVWDFSTPQPEGRIDLAVRPYTPTTDGLDRLDPSGLEVLQLQTLGFDGVLEVLPAGITVCNAVGVHEGSTAELAVALLLASQREIDGFARERGQWNRRFTASLLDRRIMLLGYGGIGVEVEKRLEGFDAELVRVAGHRREDERGVVHGNAELADLLPTVDAVVVAVPLSDATIGLVGDGFLDALPDGAVVVNVSRGKVADTDAIVRQAGRIRYATDVTDPEPLPADHPLWQVPGVLISPHVGGMSTAMQPRIDAVVRRQITHLLEGRGPDSIVISP